MRYLLLLLTTTLLWADVHFAKLEPFETVVLKAEANGRVIKAATSLEGKVANGIIVRIDDNIDKKDLQNSLASKKYIQEMIKLNKALLPALQKNLLNKKRLFKRVENLNSTSVSQKDSLYSAYISALTQFNGTKEKILNLKNQLASLNQKIATLMDRIDKKSIKVKNRYLYKLNVREGEYINIGMPIATISDISKAKLTIFLSDDELKDIDKKSIYINGKKTNLKFSKIWKIADSKYISAYRAEIVLKPIVRFSKLIKVEVK